MMKPFAGVNVAAVTPHGKRGDEPDIAGTLELIDFLCAAGVQGITLLGSTGEFVNLDSDDRVRIWRSNAAACRCWRAFRIARWTARWRWDAKPPRQAPPDCW